jgi:preprotein translocase subunit SecE
MAVAKEKKKEQQANWFARLSDEFRKVIAELRKVVWPTREETIRLTIVVLIISVVIGVFLFIGDTVFIALYSWFVDMVQ